MEVMFCEFQTIYLKCFKPEFLFEGNGYPKYGGIGGQGGCIQFVANEKSSLVHLAKK